jgi:outer membrane lipoprotein carrier protein
MGRIPRERRRWNRVTRGTLFLLFCLEAPTPMLAQSAGSARPASRSKKAPGEARNVAAAVQSFYDQTRNVAADFYQTYVHKLYKRTDRSKGKVVFQKPGKMRWDYALPNGKIIVSDGQRLLVYEPGEQGEQGQMMIQKMNEAQLPQALSFLTGSGRLEESFGFRLLDPKREGYPSGQVLELKPLEPSPHFKRILFYVESNPRLRGLVRRVLIVDPEGNRNRFDFSNLRFNHEVPASLFDYLPPPGTRVISP